VDLSTVGGQGKEQQSRGHQGPKKDSWIMMGDTGFSRVGLHGKARNPVSGAAIRRTFDSFPGAPENIGEMKKLAQTMPTYSVVPMVHSLL
jgi:hypothetical protein